MKATILLILLAPVTLLSAQEYRLPAIYSTVEQIHTGTIPLSRLTPDAQYSLLVSVPPAALGPDARLNVRLLDGDITLVSKTLHAGDADLYAPFHLGATTALDQTKPRLQLTAQGVAGKLSLQINRWPDSPQLKRGANHTWQSASPMPLGETVFASADEVEYIPVPGVARKDSVTDPRGEDWYRFRFAAARAKLIFFQLELTDRDDLPVDVSVFRVQDGKLIEYLRGQDPVAAPHEVQALPGNKFTPRVLETAGDYYVRVRANHPEYRLRTRVYDAPPYDDPRQAVRTAVDYIVAAGDSWFANTPRRGGTLDRVAPVHQETSLCVACHASHFSQRAQLVSVVNGYPVVQREQLQFLEDRFYQNPRPFYGFEQEGAVWSRVISAPANVLSRMSVLTSLFEKKVSHQRPLDYHEKIAKYLRLYYADRDQLPADETNGNTPLVSAFEVAWYSWKTLHDLQDDLSPLRPDPVLRELGGMIANGTPKNMVDLCYQTLALADMNRMLHQEVRHDQIAANAARILSLQRPDGQWSMRFDPQEPEVEFQTGHALWALAAAGIPVDHPQVKKAIDYLMHRQQDFGGWMDPLQSFENFKTPFRETQFAALALSSYFPIPGRAAGWNVAPPASLSNDPVKFLNQASAIWDQPSGAVMMQLFDATRSNDAAIRQAAAEALGRLATRVSASALTPLLGDPSKLVQRTAAWGLRRISQQDPRANIPRLLATALASPDDRVRWGATRVFAHHFGSLATDNTLVDALAKATSDPVIAVRMQAVRGLWQSWFWNADTAARGEIEDTLLGMFDAPQHPWVETNLRAAIYNLADENIRYLYNNWVALMGRDADRQRAIQGRLAVEAQLADKLAAFLASHAAPQQKRLLASLTEFPLRRADAYELSADFSTAAPLVYGRIGNDIEQIAFFGASADKLSRALLKLADSSDGETSALARKALLIVRETPFKDVEAAAGGRGAGVMEASHWLDSHSDAADIAKSFHMPPPRRPGAANASAANVYAKKAAGKLDEGYFHAYVDPIFHTKGPDGYACADCHATHTLFNATFSTVMNVVDTANPENSLLLRKPTSTAETEGVAGSATLAHGGGRRFTTGSPEYETIRKWLEGAALP
jgi:hypothetical protein